MSTSGTEEIKAGFKQPLLSSKYFMGQLSPGLEPSFHNSFSQLPVHQTTCVVQYLQEQHIDNHC